MAKTILVVEDDKELRENMVQFLTGKGYSVSASSDGAKGLRELVAKRPDLLLMDINMPYLDGLNALDLIREARIATFGMSGISDPLRIVIVSSQGDSETIERCKTLGADDFIVKPFSYEKIAQVIANLLSTPTSNSPLK